MLIINNNNNSSQHNNIIKLTIENILIIYSEYNPVSPVLFYIPFSLSFTD